MTALHHLRHVVCKTVFEIINEVAEKHGLTYIEMLSQRRFKQIALARQEAYWRCTKETLASLPMIGRDFGNRDHTTILKGAKAYEQRLREARNTVVTTPEEQLPVTE